MNFEDSPGVAIFKDLIAGTIGGCSGILVGQPLDTVKVLVQTQGHLYRGPAHCFLHTLKTHGIPGLFRGMSSPLVANAPLNAIVFAAYGNMIRNLATPEQSEVPLSHVYFAGAWAGFLSLSVVIPSDLVKCRLQFQSGNAAVSQMARGPLQSFRNTWAYGGIPALYRGFSITFIRDVPSFGFYFMAYEWVKRRMTESRGETVPGILTTLCAGGVAGLVGWSCTYPSDCVKSVIQTAPDNAPLRERKIIPVARAMYKRHGLRFFFRGFATTLVRSVPVNAVTFLIYEYILDALVPARAIDYEMAENR